MLLELEEQYMKRKDEGCLLWEFKTTKVIFNLNKRLVKPVFLNFNTFFNSFSIYNLKISIEKAIYMFIYINNLTVLKIRSNSSFKFFWKKN